MNGDWIGGFIMGVAALIVAILLANFIYYLIKKD